MTTQKTVPIKTAASTPAATTGRKVWVKKSTVEVVLEQIGRQEQKVSELRTALTHEERELSKLQQAKKVLEAV
jgi:uncharacterized linocin/CFP29 family protein